MKRNFLLTLVLALLCTTATWAQFAPVSGTKYALKEVTSGLFLDIQTKGIDDPNAKGSNNISLNAKPCIIYFEAGTTDGNWKLKNANNEYVCLQSGKAWNATIGNGSVQEWVILDSDTDGDFTIARTSDSKCIGMDKANIANAKPLYSDCTGEKVREFALVEYTATALNTLYYTLKSPNSSADTYLSLTSSGDTEASFQTTPTKFYVVPSADIYFFQNKDNAEQYVGCTASGNNTWRASLDFAWWQILDDTDNDGFVQICRNADPSKYLGNDTFYDAGKGVYSDVGSACFGWLFEGTLENYPTAATENNAKYHFTSDYITYAGGCNKIRFTLTESGAYYKNGTKRLSFDSFELYDIDGKKVELAAANVTGNNIVNFSNMLDGANGTYSSAAWDNANATDDWFEILLPKDVDLGGAFKFSFVTENTTMNAKKFTINTSYETPADYTVVIAAPEGENVTVTYNGEQINVDDKVTSVGFDKLLVDATNISGYTWSVVVNEENETITIQYTAAEVTENPDAVVALIKRVGGESAADKFKFVLDPSMNSKNEVFVIAGEEGKVLIKGTTISAITTGIGWYLNNYAHINIAWNSLNEKTVSGAAYADLSNIPVPTGEDTRTCDATYRYYLNTCTFGYSMTSWTWKRWQQEIDWMALHGVNMPLQLVGLEEVWRKFLTMEENGQRKYGYTDAEAKAFVAGPAFIAWWAMNNLEGWGGTDAGTKSGGTWDGAGGVQDDAWYARQKALAKQITDRQRELGMQPVIPGWSGMVPTNFQSKSKYTTRGNGGNWAGDFVRPLLLSVSNANYAAIAADYYKCLHEVMGESQYYSMDPFHEGGGAGTMEDYKALYAAMEAAKPGSQWVIQQWQWSATQKYSLTAVPAGRLIVLDLFSDGSPAFDGYNGYSPQDAVFCAIPNFGGRSGLMGRLNNVTDNYFKFKGKYASIKGIGTAPEAIEQTPVAYDLIYQLPWMGAKPDVAEWVENYSIARYGVANEEVQAAWELLRQGPLNYGADGIQGPVEDVWAARPNLEAYKASAWGKTLSNAMGTYNKERQLMLIDATYKLLAQNGAIAKGTVYESNYNYDIVEFGGAVMADYAYYLLTGIKEAKNASNTALYEARRDAFLALILDVDNFKGTNLNFRLGKWTQEARDAAAEAVALGATKANADWYEYNNARTIISTWSHPSTNLTDYSYRSWQGLMKDLYYPRWEYFFENNCTPERNPDAFPATPYGYFEWNWAHGMTHKVGDAGISSTPLAKGERGHTDSYTREPVGNTITEANAMLARYIIPLKTDNGTTYAYRHLTNTLSATYKVEAAEGGTIDFSKYFLADIDGATVTGDFVDDTANDITAVPVKSGIAGNTYSAAINLTDGTVINFTIVINSAEMVAAKEALATLIEKMEVLTAQVGTYNPVGEVTDFTESLTAEGTAGTTDFYVWTNAQEEAEGPIKDLVDGNTDTHFHSEYSSDMGANHFINVDLGNNNKVSSFRFTYTTRKTQTNFPKTIEVWGCNERVGTYEYITTVSNLPVGNSNSVVTYLSDRITCGKEYAYLRFTVTANNSGNKEAGGHPYFHMSEFGLEKVAATADVIDEYNGTELTDAFAVARYEILLAAKSVYKNATTAIEIEAATTNLQAAYDELNTLVEQLKPEEPEEFTALTELIDNFDVLVNKIADISYIKEIDLQKTNANSAGYISSNAVIKEADEGIGALLDKNPETHIHTQWSGNTTDGKNHYILVYLGEETSLGKFTFLYQTRNHDNEDRPKQITVAGSTTLDGEYKEIAVLTDLPNEKSYRYESPEYDATGYKYLRFMIDDTYRNLYDGSNHKAFTMAEFELHEVTVEPQAITLKPDVTTFRGITSEVFNAAYNELQDAKLIDETGNTTQKQATYNSLKAIYDALVEKLPYMPEGVYKINYNGAPTFIAYSDVIGGLSRDKAGYHLFNSNAEGVPAAAQGDMLFTISHSGAGYTLSAQGYYLKNTYHGNWAPVFFSNKKSDAGVYLFESDFGTLCDLNDEGGRYIKSIEPSIEYLNDWGKVFGNDVSTKNNPPLSKVFTLTPVTTYTLTVLANGATTLCLPFNVVLPAGVTAYDLAKANITEENTVHVYELATVATEGQTLAANTPVIIMAGEGNYTLAITMDGEGAKGSVENSLLRSGIVKTTLADGNNYTFDGENFNRVAAGTVIPANQCYMALDENLGGIIYAEAPVVVLTTDEENPVLYKIQINRNFDAPNASVLEYNANTGGVNVRADAADNSWQAWYFMAGNDGAVLIKPYNGDGKVLGADDKEDGHSKVWAVENGTKNICEWTIENNGEWYNILGDGNYFSNHSGVTYKTMGFYSDKDDNGSQFKFVEAEFTDDNARFYQLKDVKATMEDATYYSGTSVGLYSTESVTAYREKLNEAQALIDATSATSASADCYATYKALRAADEALVYNAPAANKVYYIVSTASGNGREYCSGEYVHTNSTPENRTVGNQTNTYDQRHLSYAAEGELDQLSLAAFQFVETGTQGEYKMKNLHTGLYVKAFAGTHMGAEGDAAVVKIAGVADGQVTLKIGNNAPMHAQNDFGVIVQWNCDGGNADTPSSWTIDEVPQEDLDKLYKLTVPESGITTLNLAFNVEIPDGVTVYDIVESDITKPEDSERYEFRLTEITSDGDGFVLAANTPVVIKATAGTYEFVYTADATGAIGSATGSVLKGNNYQTTPEDGTFCYVLNAEAAAFSLVEDSAAIAHNTAWMQFAEDKGTNIVSADAVEAVYPELNRVYRIKSVVTNTADEYKSHYLVNETANLAIATTAADNNSDLWVCTVADKENNEYCFVSALGTAALGWMVADEEACVFSITTGIMPGTVTLSNGTNKLALGTENYNHNGKAELFESGDDVQALNFSTDWCFEEVTDAQISFTATVRGGSSYATMYLPYAVSIPGGVAAYYAHSLNDAGNKLNLTRIESVIPKNTAVLLYRGKSNNAKANFVFSLADDVAAVANLFEGCIKQTAIPADSRVYLLLNYNSSEKFYYMADEYNADCSFVGSNGGYVKCDANKAYFKPAGAAQAVSSFGFSYSGTTAIDDLEFEVIDATAIYDLQGRKVTEPVKGCIYIKGGKKFIAK